MNWKQACAYTTRSLVVAVVLNVSLHSQTDDKGAFKIIPEDQRQRFIARLDQYMDCLRRKIAIRLGNQKAALGNLEWRHLMADVHNSRGRTNSQNDTLHDADKMVSRAEIRSQSNYRVVHGRLLN